MYRLFLQLFDFGQDVVRKVTKICQSSIEISITDVWQDLNPLSANPTKWSNTLKQFVGKSRRIVWECSAILRSWKKSIYSLLIATFKWKWLYSTFEDSGHYMDLKVWLVTPFANTLIRHVNLQFCWRHEILD